MFRNLFILILFVLSGQFLQAQTIDVTIYPHLADADPEGFLAYAKSVGLATDPDTTAHVLFAQAKGCLYAKPLGDENNDEDYELVLIISTQNKKNNKLILQNAEKVGETGFWADEYYVYREWNMENPVSKEMWYKVLVYKRKK